MAVSELPFRQSAAAGTAGTLRRRTGQSVHLPAREDFDDHVDRVQHVATLIRRPSLTVDTLRDFWRGSRRAARTVETHAHHLELNLEYILHDVQDMLMGAENVSIDVFAGEIVPHLVQQIDTVTPANAPQQALDDEGGILECHYAVSVRAALLQHVLLTINRRYTRPQFESLRDAESWTTAFGHLIADVNRVMEGTRTLLQQEVELAQRFLERRRSQLTRLEKRLRIHAPATTDIPEWERALDGAEAVMLDALSAWSDALEEAAFTELTDGRRSGGLLETVGQTVVRHAPQVSVGLLTLAAGATGAAATRDGLDLSMPEPIRSRIDGGTFRLGTIGNGSEVAVPADASTRGPGSVLEAGTNRIASIFDALPLNPGEGREVHVDTPEQLGAALVELEAQGYDRRDVLDALGLRSSDELRGPVTLELRADARGETELLVPDLAAGYEVERGDTFNGIARRFGISVERLQAANPDLDNPDVIDVGQVIRVPAANFGDASAVDDVRIPEGATLADVATTFDVTVDELTRLNRISQPDTWRYAGQELTLPMRVLDGDWQTQASVRPAPADTSAVTRDVPEPTAAASESPVTSSIDEEKIFTLKFGESGEAVATTTNRQPSLSRDGITASGYAESADGPTASERRSTTAAVAYGTLDGDAIVAKYGDTLFRSLDTMPPDARAYLLGTVQEVADFFDVRPGDILGILRAETNDTGWRLHQPAVSSAGARGVGQFVPRTWNGWSNSRSHDTHLTNMAEIVTHSGLGFDWSKRDVWQAWKDGEVPKSDLEDTDADPMVFENSVAAVARHLAHWGLTRDAAEERPDWFNDRLGDAIAVYNSGRVLSESANFTQSAANKKTVAQYVDGAIATAEAVTGDAADVDLFSSDARRDLFERVDLVYDATFGLDLSDHQLERLLAEQQMLLSDLDAGKLSPEQAALQFMDVVEQHHLAQGRAAREAGDPLPWPYVYNLETLSAQKLAVSHLGHMLDARELQQLVEETKGDLQTIRERLTSRADAQLVTTARQRIRELTGSSAPVRNSEVTALVQPLVAGKNPYQMDAGTLAQLTQQLETRIEEKYQQRNGPVTAFEAPPLNPMPRVVKAFGVAVNYQQGGKHTGIDIALPRGADGKEPPLYAVADGTVEYVGPLYCDAPRKCRGDQALVIDHGDNVYSIYSHNSSTVVRPGERVRAGQVVGRQGNEGYSYGSHLHFEVHVGAPYTGNWRQPWTGGEFVDPMNFIPNA